MLFIGLFLGRSVGQVTAIFATFVAGAAYVPISLDTTAPAFLSILTQTQMSVILTDSSQQTRLQKLLDQVGCNNIAVINVLELGDVPTKSLPGEFRHQTSASAAYVLFSSGTTGTPKGIVNSHSAVRTYCASGNEYFKATTEDKWVRAASYTFDASVEELFCPLSVGAEIVIQPDGALASFSTYLGFLSQVDATAVSMTTALWHQFANYVVQEKQPLPPSLRLIVIGGEAAMTSVLSAWRETVGDHPRFLNTYGATEATVSTTIWEGQDGVQGPVLPIGRPLKDYTCYVLDPHTQLPVEPGQDGVLFVSGPGVAIGYLDKALTKQRFVTNPWGDSAPYERMYNTGDLVRVDGEGMYWFRGRLDLQAKIRGYLVEIEAIEACLLSHPNVFDVAVVAAAEQQSKILNAYIVEASHLALDPLCADDLVEHCSRTLAPYEIPSRFYKVEKMPYTLHRKVDRRALMSLTPRLFPFRAGHLQNGSAGDVNATLAELWCQCLDNLALTSLGAQSNFIHLGGHSLAVITLAAKIHTALGVNVTAIDLLHNPTLGEMSRLLEQRESSARSAITSPSDNALAARVTPLPLPSGNTPDIPNLIPLHSTTVAQPRAMLFVFPFLSGKIDMMPDVVNKLDDGTLGLVTYGLVWQPDRDLNTLEKMSDAYVKTISTVAGSMPCFLLGWCYGGIIANHVALRLPKATTKVLLLNSPSLAVCTELLEPDQGEYSSMLIKYVCDVLGDPQYTELEQARSGRNQTREKVDQSKLAQTLQAANIDWHDFSGLIAFVREQVDFPEQVTDADFRDQCLRPLADNFDVLRDLYQNYSPTSFDLTEIESKVVLNLQNRTLSDQRLAPGLGWSRYEIFGNSNRYIYGYIPEVFARIRSVLRDLIL